MASIMTPTETKHCLYYACKVAGGCHCNCAGCRPKALDIASAKEPELLTWLAELPCPKCGGTRKLIVGGRGGGGHVNPHGEMPCTKCQDENGKPTGRALPWGSVVCDFVSYTTDGVQHTEACRCKGSGRVPKALGLADLIDTAPEEIWVISKRGKTWHVTFTVYQGYGATKDEAALRAVAAKAQAGMR